MKKKILIVDDQAINRRLICRILAEKYDVIEASGGREAIACLLTDRKSISAVLLDLVMPDFDGYEVLRQIRNEAAISSVPVIVTTGSTESDAEIRALSLGANDFVRKPYNAAVLLNRLENSINLYETSAVAKIAELDELTGIYNRRGFYAMAAEMIHSRPAGYYIMSCFDIANFKVINDLYGIKKGDDVLIHIAETFRHGFGELGGICCRLFADNYAVLYPAECLKTDKVEKIRRAAVEFDSSDINIPKITFTVGRYRVVDLSLPVSGMYDRAYIAMSGIKGRVDVHIAEYDETMRTQLLIEQAIVNDMASAIENRNFEVWLQPQYNHSSGALIGSEALVRWRHPQKGFVSPGVFIPVFERNGFIYELDKYVWEEACRILRHFIDTTDSPLPVSVNISRHDIVHDDFLDVLTGLVEKYDIPIPLLRLEITESAFSQSAERLISVVKQLVELGFTVEIDDFGSGYSSLNTLKDVPADILKLDMKFLERGPTDTDDLSASNSRTRGGSILESVVRMAKWLGMSVIAEGVETVEQADYLESIGCSYIQGYYYARPMPVQEFEALATHAEKEVKMIKMEASETFDNYAFWDPASLDTLIFNSYVGGACIFEFDSVTGGLEMLRANRKYARDLGGPDMTPSAAINFKWENHVSAAEMSAFKDAIRHTLECDEEGTVDISLKNLAGSADRIYLRATVSIIARAGRKCLVYCVNKNITEQRQAELASARATGQLQSVIDNIGSGITAITMENGRVSYQFINNRFYDIFGYTEQQFNSELGSTFEVVHPDERQSIVEFYDRIHEEKQPAVCEFRGIKRDGTVIYIKGQITFAEIEGVDDLVQLNIYSDITHERESAVKLQEAYEQLTFLNDTARDLLSETDAGIGVNRVLGKLCDYFSASRAFIYEYEYDKNLCRVTYEIFSEDGMPSPDSCRTFSLDYAWYWLKSFERSDIYRIEDTNDENVPEAEKRRSEFEVYRRLEVHSVLAVALKFEGRVIGTIGVYDPTDNLRDIENLRAVGDYMAAILTRRDYELRLKEQSALMRDLMRDTPGGFTRSRYLNGGILVPVYINEGFCRMVGMSEEQAMREYSGDALLLVHPDEKSKMREFIERMLSVDKPDRVICRLRRAGGDYISVMIFARLTRDEDGGLFCNLYYTDLSQGNSALGDGRRVLSEREMLPYILNGIMDSTTDLTFVKDTDMKYICGSRSFMRLVGINEGGSLIGKSDYDLFNRSLADRYREDDLEVLESGVAMIDKTEEIPAAGKLPSYSLTSKYPLRDSLGSIIGILGVGRDITEYRSIMEQRNLLADNIPGGVGVCELNRNGDIRLLYFNRGFYQSLGFSREEYTRLSRINPLFSVFREDLELFHAAVIELWNGDDKPNSVIFRVKTKQFYENSRENTGDSYRDEKENHASVGIEYRYMNMRSTVSERSEDKLILNVVKYDVTEQMQNEERLRIHEEELRLALTQMSRPVLLFDIPSRTLTVPPSFANLHGFSPVLKNIPDREFLSKYVFYCDLDEFCQFFNEIIGGKKHCTARAHLLCADGTWRYELGESVTIFDKDGNPIRAVISIQDITEQRERDQANDILSKLYEDYYAMYLFDTERSLCTPLRFSTKVSTLSHGEAASWHRTIDTIVPKMVCPEYLDSLLSALDINHIRNGFGDESDRFEMIYCQNGGSWMKLVIRPLRINDGVTSLAVATIADITESKRQVDGINEEMEKQRKRVAEYERLLFDAAAGTYTGILKITAADCRVYKIVFENEMPVEHDTGILWENYFGKLMNSTHPDDRELISKKTYGGDISKIPPGNKVAITYRRKPLEPISPSASDVPDCTEPPYRWYTTTIHTNTTDESNTSTCPRANVATVFTIDINDEMIERIRLKDLSEHDGLTYLFNRVKLEAMCMSEYVTLVSCGVLFFDVNFLKSINDAEGHDAGDFILNLVADSIRSITSRRIHGYRYGGDEFVVIVCNGKEDELSSLLQMWRTRLNTLARENGVFCSVAAGRAFTQKPKNGPISVLSLINAADADMYINKELMKRL